MARLSEEFLREYRIKFRDARAALSQSSVVDLSKYREYKSREADCERLLKSFEKEKEDA